MTGIGSANADIPIQAQARVAYDYQRTSSNTKRPANMGASGNNSRLSQVIHLEQKGRQMNLTWRDHISYRWHVIRYAVSKKYRKECDLFEREIQIMFEKGLLK